MASNNHRAPSVPPLPRWSNESKTNSVEQQQLILNQVKEMFDSILEPEIILSVVQNCKWKLQPSIEALIMLSESAEVPLNCNRQNPSQGKGPTSSNFISKSSNISDEKPRNKEREKQEYRLNVGQDTSGFLNLDDMELLRQQEELQKFELLKKDLTKKRFLCSENENMSKSSYSQESTKISLPKLQQFSQTWSNEQTTEKADSAKIYICSDVENNSQINPTINKLWHTSTIGQKKVKETNSQYDNLFGSKLQFSRDPPNKICNKGTIPKNCTFQFQQPCLLEHQKNDDPAIILTRNAQLNDLENLNVKGRSSTQSQAVNDAQVFSYNTSLTNDMDYKSKYFNSDFEERQQQVAQFDSNYDNETKTRSGSGKSNLHKGETESLCGLKVQYRLPGLENSSDDDADVVIEEEQADYPTQIPSLMSINVCHFISNSTQSPPKNTHPEIGLTRTSSPPRSHQPHYNHNTHDGTLKTIIASIIRGHKVLIILRGLPGSGKSHLATSIVRASVGGDASQFIFSTDDYFVMLGRGSFQYVRSKLSEAHSYNQKKVYNALKEGLSPVIVSNTNTQLWEMQPYVVMGVQSGYVIEVLEPNTPWCRNVNELAKKNTHGIAKERIKRMMERYEHNITGAQLIEKFSLRYSSENAPPQLRKIPSIGGVIEGERKNEQKLKLAKRNRRKKKNLSGTGDTSCLKQNTDSPNYLRSDLSLDKNIKHLENSPALQENDDTLSNIVPNTLMSENDTLHKSLVDYCIETDSGDELDIDSVPIIQKNSLTVKQTFNLLRPDPDETEPIENIQQPAASDIPDFTLPPACPITLSKSNDVLHPSKNSDTFHQQSLGAIGSERKSSVTAIDYEKPKKIAIDVSNPDSGENVLSQCWDFTLLLNGRQIHSVIPTPKSRTTSVGGSKILGTELNSEIVCPSTVIITEIETECAGIDEYSNNTDIFVNKFETREPISNNDYFRDNQLMPDDPETIITKIIDKMDSLELETNLKCSTDATDIAVDTELVYDVSESQSDSQTDCRSEDTVSSIGSIFSTIKKSLLGLNSKTKYHEQNVETEESMMKFKHQTNDNSLSENDAFENEKSHREPISVICNEDVHKPEEDLGGIEICLKTVGDSLTKALSGFKAIELDINFDAELYGISKTVTYDTLESNAHLGFVVEDTLSSKLCNETIPYTAVSGSSICALNSLKYLPNLQTRNQTRNPCIYTQMHADEVFVKNLVETNSSEKDKNIFESQTNLTLLDVVQSLEFQSNDTSQFTPTYDTCDSNKTEKSLCGNLLDLDAKDIEGLDTVEKSNTLSRINVNQSINQEINKSLKNSTPVTDTTTKTNISRPKTDSLQTLGQQMKNNSEIETKHTINYVVDNVISESTQMNILNLDTCIDMLKSAACTSVPDVITNNAISKEESKSKAVDSQSEKNQADISSSDTGQNSLQRNSSEASCGECNTLAESFVCVKNDVIEDSEEAKKDLENFLVLTDYLNSNNENALLSHEDCKAGGTSDINLVNHVKDEDDLNIYVNTPELLISKEDTARSKGNVLEVIDNINQVTWKESPFPVPAEQIPCIPEFKEKLDTVSRTDSSTNTSNYDFNVLYVGGTLEPKYKILKTENRAINNNVSMVLEQKPPLKLMLDKSSMTSVVDILSGEESLEFQTEIESMRALDELMEMFPNVMREDVAEIYKNLCNCDFNWAVDVLLDGVPEHVIKYINIKSPKIVLDGQSSSPSKSEATDLDVQNSTLCKERLQNLKQQSSSASDNSDSKCVKQNSSPRKKERHRVSEQTLELNRQIEEKMIFNKASYNPHILRVKRWKYGEPDIAADDNMELSPQMNSGIEFSHTVSIGTEELVQETQSPKSSESTDDFTEEDIIHEEIIELNLGQDFIKILEKEFGNPEFQFPGSLFPVIQIKKSMAQQLHALWIESMEQQLNAQQEQLDKMIETDAKYARSLEQEEARSLTESLIPNLPEIMDMEMALAIYNNDLKKQQQLETPNDMASRLTRQMLYEMFPDNDPETLNEILKAHNGNFKETVDVLEASTGQTVNRNNTLKKQKSLIDQAKNESIRSVAGETESAISATVVNVDQENSPNSNLITLTYDAAVEEAQASRKEAQRHLSLRTKNFNKATEAFRKGNREVAGYYSQMAKLHSKKMEYANSTAASAFLAAQDYMMNTENTLDLHNLYVAEALQALDVFLDYQISRLNEGTKKSVDLYIITGRGAHSSRGLSRIKPAVSKKLASKNIRFVHENPGCLKIVIYRRNCAMG